MTRADLHLHSCYSRHPAEWFLKRLGAQESYTDIEDLYHSAKQRGMDFVTLTDHNTIEGALELSRRHPEDTFVSVEATAYFPESGCKIHVLVYDIDADQFERIDTLRRNIYELRDYLADTGIVHSVAHATYDVNNRLNADLVEKLIVLFNTFEGINGARSPYYARQWMKLLSDLTPGDIRSLESKHGIRSVGRTPWAKAITAGSDDHAGLFQALTWTEGPECATPAEFLKAVNGRRTRAGGRSHDFKTFAFSIYKIAYDFSKSKASADSVDLFMLVNSVLFESNGNAMVGALMPEEGAAAQEPAEGGGQMRDALLLGFLKSLADDLKGESVDLDERFNRIYANIASLIDAFFVQVMDSVAMAIRKASPGSLIQSLISALPFFFLSAPFATSLRHLSRDRLIANDLAERLSKPDRRVNPKVLWFTDTIHDLNGVSISLRQIAWHAFRTDRRLTLVTCHGGGNIASLPPNVMNLESVYTYTPDVYASYTFHFPSLLKALDRISAENPERIIISTPGPVGVVGLLAARMLSIPCTGVYHTDFKTQLDLTVQDASLSSFVLQYDRAFFSRLDEIRVPSKAYVRILADRGYPADRLKVFERGINTALFDQRDQAGDGFTLIWAGRISHDKNIRFLFEVFRQARKCLPYLNLRVAGDGPDADFLRQEAGCMNGISFVGLISHEDLPGYYNSGDLFVFPSTMDTFGMAVLEAQACGIPALVTDVGGPQEIVEMPETGRVIPADDVDGWVEAILWYAALKADDPEGYRRMKQTIAHRIQTRYSWEKALSDMIGTPEPDEIRNGEAALTRSA